jgi:molecular chaperone DnaJ
MPMDRVDRYDLLEIPPSATLGEIKSAYRRMAKLYHPDTGGDRSDAERFAAINDAYEVLIDPRRRANYDRERQHPGATSPTPRQSNSSSPTATGVSEDSLFIQWKQQVYTPVNRLINWILKPLREQVKALSGDPFDDDLMSDFSDYIESCRRHWQRAEKTLHSLPNPSMAGGVAANLYYVLERISDGLNEFNYYINSYDDRCLHDGQEMFRIAGKLHKEAQRQMKQF